MTDDNYTVKRVKAVPSGAKETGKWRKEWLHCTSVPLDSPEADVYTFASRTGALRLQSALRAYAERNKTAEIHGWTLKTSVRGSELIVQRVSVAK